MFQATDESTLKPEDAKDKQKQQLEKEKERAASVVPTTWTATRNTNRLSSRIRRQQRWTYNNKAQLCICYLQKTHIDAWL